MNRWRRLLAVLILTYSAATATPIQSLQQPACATAHGWLFLARDNQAVVLDPGNHATASIDLPPAAIERLHRPLILRDIFQSSAWEVRRESWPDAYEFTVVERDTGEVVHTATFTRRIEIAASTVSPSGRYTVFIQANNLGSEITVLDASAGLRRDLRIPHDEELAAFAIDSAFSRDESCLAVSMERVGGNGPETWLVDLETGEVSPAIPGFVITWA